MSSVLRLQSSVLRFLSSLLGPPYFLFRPPSSVLRLPPLRHLYRFRHFRPSSFIFRPSPCPSCFVLSSLIRRWLSPFVVLIVEVSDKLKIYLAIEELFFQHHIRNPYVHLLEHDKRTAQEKSNDYLPIAQAAAYRPEEESPKCEKSDVLPFAMWTKKKSKQAVTFLEFPHEAKPFGLWDLRQMLKAEIWYSEN